MFIERERERERDRERERGMRKKERKSEREIISLCNTSLVMCMKCFHGIKVYIYLSEN